MTVFPGVGKRFPCSTFSILLCPLNDFPVVLSAADCVEVRAEFWARSNDPWTQISASRTVDFPVESSLQSAAQMKSNFTSRCDVGCEVGFAEKYSYIFAIIALPFTYIQL